MTFVRTESNETQSVQLAVCSVVVPIMPPTEGGLATPSPCDFLVKDLLPKIFRERGLHMHLLDPPETRVEYVTETLQCILESPLMMFDLTWADPAICTELGLRYMSGRPFIAFVAKSRQTDVPMTLRHIKPIAYADNELREAEAEVHTRLDNIRKPQSVEGRPLFRVLPGGKVVVAGHELTRPMIAELEAKAQRRAASGGKTIGHNRHWDSLRRR
jgi:hypothetical protein